MANLHPVIERVTARIIDKSQDSRRRYLDLIEAEAEKCPGRGALSCSNLAHGFAAALEDKGAIASGRGPNLAIVTACNDQLWAHQPYGRYPEAMKLDAREVGATAQVAGGALAYLRDGDRVRLCAQTGTLTVLDDISQREPVPAPRAEPGMGRELFALLRNHTNGAEAGASATLAEAGL